MAENALDFIFLRVVFNFPTDRQATAVMTSVGEGLCMADHELQMWTQARGTVLSNRNVNPLVTAMTSVVVDSGRALQAS